MHHSVNGIGKVATYIKNTKSVFNNTIKDDKIECSKNFTLLNNVQVYMFLCKLQIAALLLKSYQSLTHNFNFDILLNCVEKISMSLFFFI